MDECANTYAPILIPTLNRYEHFRRCVESLSRCTDAERTELIIGLDYPPSEKYEDGWKKIKEYLQTIKGFKKVTILNTQSNLNAFVNSERLWKYAFDNGYDAAIYTEDDNEFSPNFLSYCNWALTYFKDDKRILYVCGYNLVNVPDIKNNLYVYNHAFCAWGCATWKDRKKREVDNYNMDNMKQIVNAYPLSIIFNKSKVFMASSLLYMIKKNYVLGDTAIHTIPDNERWCVFPKLSLVRNWGHDGSGLHGGTEKSYQEQIHLTIDQSNIFDPNIVDDLFTPEIRTAYQKKFGKKPFIYNMRCICRFLIYKITGKIVIIEKPK